MLKSNYKFSSAIKSIAVVLALIAVLVMSLAGCTDEEARKMAQEAADKANAAITQTQLNDAVTAALADYAKKTDAVTTEGVATAIENALKDYAKTADLTLITMDQVNAAITGALANYPTTDKTISKADVEALIATAQETIGNQIKNQATANNDYAKAEADKKIDEAAWHALTGTYEDLDDIETVVGACRKVDQLVREIEGKFSLYIPEDYQLALDLCEAAKVRYIRATKVEDLDIDELEKQIDDIPTVITEAARIAELIINLPLPITTWHEDLVLNADENKVNEAGELVPLGVYVQYENWKEAYEKDDEFARSKDMDIDKLYYAVGKLADLKVKYDAVNDAIAKFYLDHNITLVGDGSDLDAAKALAAKIALADEAGLVAINDLYESFVGDCDDPAITDWNNDDDDNNGDNGNKIPYWAAVTECFEALNFVKFEDAKTLFVAKLSANMDTLLAGYVAAADATVNEELRNAVRTLTIAINKYVEENVIYSAGKYAYGDANFIEVFARAKAHLDAVEAKFIAEAFAELNTAFYTKADGSVATPEEYAEDHALVDAANVAVKAAVEDYIANKLPAVIEAAFTATVPQA